MQPPRRMLLDHVPKLFGRGHFPRAARLRSFGEIPLGAVGRKLSGGHAVSYGAKSIPIRINSCLGAPTNAPGSQAPPSGWRRTWFKLFVDSSVQAGGPVRNRSFVPGA